MKKILKNKLFHKFVRWGLGIHGAVHILETLVNLYEKAYISAMLSLFIGLLMIAGAYIDSSHHNLENKNKND
jgi:hypothetical protein